MKSGIFARTLATATVFASLLAATPAMKAMTSDADQLAPYSRMTYNNVFVYGGEHAAVAVQGDGASALRVRVYDYNNYLISDTSCRVNACVVEWVAKWNANFHVVVDNLGGYTTSYGFALERKY